MARVAQDVAHGPVALVAGVLVEGVAHVPLEGQLEGPRLGVDLGVLDADLPVEGR